MNLAKQWYTKSIFRNQRHFCIPTLKYQKQKLWKNPICYTNLILFFQLQICIPCCLPPISTYTHYKQFKCPNWKYLLDLPNSQSSVPSLHPISVNGSQMACQYLYYHKCVIFLTQDFCRRRYPSNEYFLFLSHTFSHPTSMYLTPTHPLVSTGDHFLWEDSPVDSIYHALLERPVYCVYISDF